MKSKFSNNKENKGSNKLLKILSFIVIIIIFIRLGIVIYNNKDNLGNRNLKMFSFIMPTIQGGSEEANNNEKAKISYEDLILEVLGIDKGNFPIISNELSFFNQGSDYKSSELAGYIQPFKLNEESIVKIDGSDIYDESLKKTLDNSKPEVLIYHTHTSEAYIGAGKFDSTDENNNIVGVGDVIADELEKKYGISVIHDKTNHCVSYDKSYSRSNETVKKYIDKYGDFKIILDLHRDGLGQNGSKSMSTVSINGVNTAQIFFVNSKGSTRYAKQRELTDFLSNKCNELYPGLLKKETIFNKGGLCKENLNLSDNAILVECGSEYNSIDEAKEGGKVIARLLAEKINIK